MQESMTTAQMSWKKWTSSQVKSRMVRMNRMDTLDRASGIYQVHGIDWVLSLWSLLLEIDSRKSWARVTIRKLTAHQQSALVVNPD